MGYPWFEGFQIGIGELLYEEIKDTKNKEESEPMSKTQREALATMLITIMLALAGIANPAMVVGPYPMVVFFLAGKGAYLYWRS